MKSQDSAPSEARLCAFLMKDERNKRSEPNEFELSE